MVIEAKASPSAIDEASEDVKGYGDALCAEGCYPLAVALAGTEADEFKLLVFKSKNGEWVPITYDGHPISWIPSKEDARRLAVPDSTEEIRPSPPPEYVLATSSPSEKQGW